MENKACPIVTVNLDKERHLQFDFNALETFEDQIGISMFDLEGNFSVKVVKAALWAGLLREDEELTLKQVGAMIYGSNMLYVQQQINKALELSITGNEGKVSKNE